MLLYLVVQVYRGGLGVHPRESVKILSYLDANLGVGLRPSQMWTTDHRHQHGHTITHEHPHNRMHRTSDHNLDITYPLMKIQTYFSRRRREKNRSAYFTNVIFISL